MASRRKRRGARRNPSVAGWFGIALGAITLGAMGYGGYRLYKDWRRKKLLDGLPVPTPRPGDVSSQTPIPPVNPCGNAYPGFVDEGEGCVPTDATPGGIYLNAQCTDFVFVKGDEGPQIDWLEDVVADEVLAAKSQPAGQSTDPTLLATDFFTTFWGDCDWPPDPSAPSRIVNVYEAIALVIAREVVREGGRVLGTTDPNVVDQALMARLAELGLPPFSEEEVAEIPLPSAFPDPSTGGDGGGVAKPGQISVAP